jgi:thioredoxin 1
MAGPDTMQFTEDSFEDDVIRSTQPVLVDFWAEWCGPCKALGPTIDELATEYAGRVKVGKIDVDSNQSLAAQFEISNIPTVLLFKGGQIAERFVGLRSKRDLAAAIDQLIG